MGQKAVSQVVDIARSDIVTSGGTQSRVELSEQAVADYAEAMQAGAKLPPIVVFHDGSTYWLADGFHRVMAAIRAGAEWLAAEVKQGTKRDAILYSVGANSEHGLPRTNADKRRSVEMLLGDAEWAAWSNREIARRCSVDDTFVGNMRRSLPTNRSETTTKTYTTKHGTVATMRTENIGKRDTGTLMKDGRKLVLPHGRKLAEVRAKEIIELAEQGNRAEQIAQALGIGLQQVRNIAKDQSITLPDAIIGKTRRVDSRRVIEQTVMGLEASAQSLNTIPVSFDGIDAAEAADWAKSVEESLKIFRKFHKQLTEVANG